MSADDSTNHNRASSATPELRTSRGLLTYEQLVYRFGCMPPRVYLIESMPDGRIVEAVAARHDIRPLMAFAMNPRTFARAEADAMKRWGLPSTLLGHNVEPLLMSRVNGRELIVPLMPAQGAWWRSSEDIPSAPAMVDWRIDLSDLVGSRNW